MKNPSVIIIKKVKKGGHGGHHGGAWKVAYADFVTAMMAFFLVMWLVAQSNAVKAAVAGYFKDPGVFDYEKSTGMIPGGEQAPLNPDAPPQRRDSQQRPVVGGGRQARRSRRWRSRVHAVLENMPEFKKLGKQIEMQVTPEGLRIELLEGARGDVLRLRQRAAQGTTPSACSAPSPRNWARCPTTSSLEGHTDSQPYSRGERLLQLGAVGGPRQRRAADHGSGRARGAPGEGRARLRRHAGPGCPTSRSTPRNRRVSIVVVTNFGALDGPSASPVRGPRERSAAVRGADGRAGGRSGRSAATH